MSLSSFVRTWLPLLILATVVIFNWPSGKLDFGNTSPWAGIILEVDLPEPLANEPGLILAGLPVQDIQGQPGLFVCGAVEWKPGVASQPILLAGRVDELRLQQAILLQETIALHRSPLIRFVLHQLPPATSVTDLIGSLIQENSLKLRPVSPNSQPVLLDIGPERAKKEYRVEFDKETQIRWRGEPARFRALWEDQLASDAQLLEPYRHGKVVFPATAPADGVATEEGR